MKLNNATSCRKCLADFLNPKHCDINRNTHYIMPSSVYVEPLSDAVSVLLVICSRMTRNAKLELRTMACKSSVNLVKIILVFLLYPLLCETRLLMTLNFGNRAIRVLLMCMKYDLSNTFPIPMH